MSEFLLIILTIFVTLVLVSYVIYSEYRRTCIMEMKHIAEFGVIAQENGRVVVTWNRMKGGKV